MPYDIVKMNHPLLAKWPVLLPGFYFVRLVKMPFRKKARQSAGTDLRVAFSKETEAEKQTAKMMQALGMVDNDLL